MSSNYSEGDCNGLVTWSGRKRIYTPLGQTLYTKPKQCHFLLNNRVDMLTTLRLTIHMIIFDNIADIWRQMPGLSNRTSLDYTQ